MKKDIRRHLTVALAASFSFLLMLIETPLPVFPVFLKMDISDLPSLIVSLSLGPFSGVAVEFLKNFIHGITVGSTAYIGEWANFLLGSVFVLVAGSIFRRRDTRGALIWGLSSATIAMSLCASFLNYLVLLPLYEKVLGFPVEAVIAAASETNAAIDTPFALILWAILPFNLLKGFILSVAGYYTAKKMHII